MERKPTSLTAAALIATVTLATMLTTRPATAACDLFEEQMACGDFEMIPFCGGAEDFTGMDSDIHLSYCSDGTPVSQCDGGYSCQDPEPIQSYVDQYTDFSNPPRFFAAHYFVGDKASYKGNSYKCLQEHTAKKKSNPTQSYSKWERLVKNSAWTLQAIYERGRVVTYKGHSYAALNVSQAKSGHEPSKDHRLWRKI